MFAPPSVHVDSCMLSNVDYQMSHLVPRMYPAPSELISKRQKQTQGSGNVTGLKFNTGPIFIGTTDIFIYHLSLTQDVGASSSRPSRGG